MRFIKIFVISASILNVGNVLNAMPVADEFKERALTELPIPLSPEPELFSEHHIIAALSIAIVLLSIAVLWLINDRRRQKNLHVQTLRAETYFKCPVFAVDSFQNKGKRREQQDAFYFSNPVDANVKGMLAVVADGMGGMQGGAIMSRIVAETFHEQFDQILKVEPKEFLLDTGRAAELAVENHIMRTKLNGGSTVAAIMIKGDELYFISVGDSRIYWIHDGQLIQLNEEHTYGAQLLKKAALGEISKDKALNDPDRHALIAYVGMGSFKIFDRNEQSIKLTPNDKVLLCSDGVFNALDNAELLKALNGDVHFAAQRLEKSISDKAIRDQDNFTGVIIEFQMSRR